MRDWTTSFPGQGKRPWERGWWFDRKIQRGAWLVCPPPSSTATLEIFEKRKTTNLLLKHRQLRPSDKCKPVKLLITFRCRRIHFHNFTLLSDKRFWNSWKTVMITYAVTLKWELLYFFVLLLVRYKQSGANFLTIAWNHLAKGLLWVCLRMGEDDSASARNLLFFFYSLR